MGDDRSIIVRVGISPHEARCIRRAVGPRSYQLGSLTGEDRGATGPNRWLIQARSTAKRSSFVRGPQDYARRLTRFECFLPAGRTKAPTIAGLRASKAEIRYYSRKIVAARFGKLEKRGGNTGAERVATDVLLPGFAAAVSKKNSAIGFIEQTSRRSPSTLRGTRRRLPHCHCPPSTLPDSIAAAIRTTGRLLWGTSTRPSSLSS